MKKALISPDVKMGVACMLAQVEPEDGMFEVAAPLVWVDCPDDVTVDSHLYNPTNNTFQAFPPPVVPSSNT
jgi:hypothetical protein